MLTPKPYLPACLARSPSMVPALSRMSMTLPTRVALHVRPRAQAINALPVTRGLAVGAEHV